MKTCCRAVAEGPGRQIFLIGPSGSRLILFNCVVVWMTDPESVV